MTDWPQLRTDFSFIFSAIITYMEKLADNDIQTTLPKENKTKQKTTTKKNFFF